MSGNNSADIEKAWLKRIRNFIGILGMILPWISLVGAILVARTKGIPDDFWERNSEGHPRSEVPVAILSFQGP